MRGAFAHRLAGRGDAELAETFYNSCVRRTFHTVAWTRTWSSWRSARPPRRRAERGAHPDVPRQDRLDSLVRQVLEHQAFAVPWDDLEGDARRVASEIVAEADVRRIRAVELARPVFFRAREPTSSAACSPTALRCRCCSRSRIPPGASSWTPC